MNKYFTYLITGVVAASLFASCNDNNGMLDESRVPVQFTAATASAVQTRTSVDAGGATQWELDDAVGIFMTGDAGNRKYIVSNASSGALSPDGVGNTLYYPQGNVDFIAYYPWLNGQTLDNYAVDVADQTAPAAIDLLYSNNATGKNKTSGTVNLEFKHVLAKLAITVQKGTGVTSLAGLSVKMKGMNTQTAFDLSNGSFGTASNLQDITPLCTQTPSATANGLYEAILIPAATTGATVEFSLNGETYVWNLAANLPAFAGSNRYGFTVTMQKTGITVSPGNITLWTGTGASAQTVVSNKLIETVLITKGSFTMGSPTTEPDHSTNETQHTVMLTQDFYMGKYEVTNTQYAVFLNDKGVGSTGQKADIEANQKLIWASSSPYDWGLHWNSGASKWEPAPGCAIRPVIRVTWYGAKAFAEWADGSLPTEAQWEYACRAGTTTAYSYGAAANGNYMWYDSNSGSVTHDVGLKQPNPWGLYDMHGNVFEWCSDWYVDYGSAAATDPTGATSGSNRVLRGGDWYYDAEDCRSANRLSDPPGSSSLSYGFRVVWVQ